MARALARTLLVSSFTMKKNTKTPKQLLLRTEKVRDLRPLSDKELAGAVGGLGSGGGDDTEPTGTNQHTSHA